MRRLLLAAAVSGLLIVAAGPVVAHPFGPPPTALVTADGDTVEIAWSAAADDAIAVGVEIGLATEDMVEAYLAESSAQAAPPGDVEEAISASDELVDYLTEHIVVRQDGQRCEATVEPVDDFVWDGATVTHRCPEQIGEVEVEISMLHERHPAYRTFALAAESADPPQAVFTPEEPAVRWDLSAARGAAIDGDPDARLTGDGAAGEGSGGDGARAMVVAAAPVVALVGVVGLASGAVAWRGRRRRRDGEGGRPDDEGGRRDGEGGPRDGGDGRHPGGHGPEGAG